MIFGCYSNTYDHKNTRKKRDKVSTDADKKEVHDFKHTTGKDNRKKGMIRQRYGELTGIATLSLYQINQPGSLLCCCYSNTYDHKNTRKKRDKVHRRR